MPLGQSQDILQADPGGRVSPRFRHRLIRFRRFCSGSLALASLNLACRNIVPTFPQRSLPLLLTTAACGGLRSAPDCRPRGLPSSLVQLRNAVWTGGTRDTRPRADVDRFEIPQRSTSRCDIVLSVAPPREGLLEAFVIDALDYLRASCSALPLPDQN